MKQQRLSLCLSATALVVAFFGSTPLGQAATHAVRSVVPYAKKAGYAKIAGNAALLNGHKASASGTPGSVVVVGANGQLPASVGAVGPAGSNGTNGTNGTAVAYAHVAIDGTVDPARSLNVTQAMVTHPQKGVYCFNNLGFTPKNIIANVGGNVGSGTGPVIPAVVADIPSFSICSSQAEVGMVDPSTGGFSRDASFFVTFN